MSENEKIQKEELEQVPGGFNPDLERNPEVEIVCPKCGCKYTHRNPGLRGSMSATRARCPKCEGGVLGDLVEQLKNNHQMQEIRELDDPENGKVSGGVSDSKLEEYDKLHSSTHTCRYCGKKYKLYDEEIFNDACHECRKIPLKDRVIRF